MSKSEYEVEVSFLKFWSKTLTTVNPEAVKSLTPVKNSPSNMHFFFAFISTRAVSSSFDNLSNWTGFVLCCDSNFVVSSNDNKWLDNFRMIGSYATIVEHNRKKIHIIRDEFVRDNKPHTRKSQINLPNFY